MKILNLKQMLQLNISILVNTIPSSVLRRYLLFSFSFSFIIRQKKKKANWKWLLLLHISLIPKTHSLKTILLPVSSSSFIYHFIFFSVLSFGKKNNETANLITKTSTQKFNNSQTSSSICFPYISNLFFKTLMIKKNFFLIQTIPHFIF